MLTRVMVMYYKLRGSKKIQTQACINNDQTLPHVCLYYLENQRIREELCVRSNVSFVLLFTECVQYIFFVPITLLLRYKVTLVRNSIPTFRRIVISSSSRSGMS
jgi:hypothetical protein